MQWYKILRKELVGQLPAQFEREMAYMNFVYSKTQCGFELFENIGKLPRLMRKATMEKGLLLKQDDLAGFEGAIKQYPSSAGKM